MSKDKYSDDHTIAVDGGTQTVIVEDNLDVIDTVTADIVTGTTSINTISLSATDITATNDLTVSNNADVGQTLTADTLVVTGAPGITSTNYSFDSSRDVAVEVPLASVKEAITLTYTNNDTFAYLDGNGGTGPNPSFRESLTLHVGQTSNGTPWDITFPLTSYLKHGSTIDRVVMIVEPITVGASLPALISLNGKVKSFDAIGDDVVVTDESTDTAPLQTIGGAPLGGRQRLTFNANVLSVDIDASTSSKSYLFELAKTDTGAGQELTIAIYRIFVVSKVTTIEQAVHEII